MTIRVDNDLYALVTACAAHCGLTMSDVARRTLRWASRNVEQLQKRDCSTYGGRVLNVRGFELVGAAEFRFALWMRCTEALSKPAKERFETPLKAGRDYIVKELD